ncbi:MAG: TolC family protein [Clostridium sp.]|nr:TolC family protein [Clostridium sp.]
MKALILTVALALPMIAVQAQELTMEQCRESALQYNKKRAAAARGTEAAAYTLRSTRALFFPDLKITGGAAYSTADGGLQIPGGLLPVLQPLPTGQLAPGGSFAYFPGVGLDYEVGPVFMAGVTLKQPLYTGGKIRAGYGLAKCQLEAARLQEALTETEVIVAADRAYVQVVKAQEMTRVAYTYRQLLEELLRNVQSAVKHGLKLTNDELKVKVKLNESELSLRKAENARRLAMMNLCHVMGRPLTDSLTVSSSLPEVDGLLQEGGAMLSARPEYALLEKQTEAAALQVKYSRADLLPQVGLVGAYDYLNGIKVNDEKLFEGANFSAMLSVSIPLFHFGERTGKVKAARAKLEQARAEQEDLNEQMMLELSRACNNLDEARLECELAMRSLEQAEENRLLSEKSYRAGVETLSDVLEAQALWQQAYESKVDAYFRLYLAGVDYRKAAGKLVDL